MFKSIAFGIGSGFLGIAGAAFAPVLVGILAAFGGATAIVGLGAWREFRKMQRNRRQQDNRVIEVTAGPGAPPTVLPPPAHGSN